MMTSCIMGVTRCRGSGAFPLIQLLFVFLCLEVRMSAQQEQAWLQKPQNQLVPLGGTATFVCKSPTLKTNIAWTKGTQVLYVNQSKFSIIPDRYNLTDPFTLTISQVVVSDTDMYGCNVQDFGTASANLTVLLPPGPPSITTDPANSIFQEEQLVRFTCSSTGGNPPPTIVWMKNGLEQINVRQTVTEGSTTRNTLSVTLDHSDHQANYTCYVYNRVNENNTLTASKVLNVRYSPIVTVVPFSPYTVRLGSPGNITCQVDANPPVSSVTWRKDGKTLSGNNFVRLFTPVVRSDTGNYTCSASNPLSSSSPTTNSTSVVVVYPPKVSVPSVKNVAESTLLTITCSIDANPYPYLIIWEKVLPNGQRRQKATSETLRIPQIKREDAGNYSCKSSSLLKVTGVSAPETVSGEAFTYINILYRPGVAAISPVGNINVGERLEITCSASPTGFPPAQFRWHRNGAEQPSTSAKLVITRARLSHSGIYSCTPYNSVGDGTPSSVNISINEPPKLLEGLPEPDITRTISNTQPLTMTCKGQGRPEPTIAWFKDNMTESLLTVPQFYTISTQPPRVVNSYSREVTSMLAFLGSGREIAPSGDRTKLRIEDLGRYTCRVTSPVHTVAPSSTVALKINFAPVVTKSMQKTAVTVSDRSNLPCEAQAFPPPVFQWYRNGKPVDTDMGKFSLSQMVVKDVVSGYKSVLTIRRVGASDYGLYYCFVSNPMANVTSIVNVTTRSTPEAPTSLRTLGRTWESVHLQWSPGFNGGYTQSYQIQVQEQGPTANAADMYVIPAQPLTETDFNVTGLKPSTTYKFSVFGRNRLGNGQHSIPVTKNTWELEIPTLGEAVPIFHPASRQLMIPSQPSSQYCLKIDAKSSAGVWRTVQQCARVLGVGFLEVKEQGIVDLNVSVCLAARPEVCGPPVKAQISQSEKKQTLTERDVIIIACVCAVIIIVLLIVLICFICRRRRANAKEYENSGVSPSASNGGIPGKKMQQGQGQGQTYDNADGRYPTFASSSDHQPPNYWDTNPLDHHYDHRHNLSFDSQADRQMYEHDLELNRRNDMALYGRADGFRAQQESIHMQGRPMSPTKDRYIDLEDRKDPSLQSQESGYSTGDPNKPKKTIHFGFGWRPPRPFSARRRNLTRMRKKQKSQPHPRFSHSPPGHTCGLPCCSEDLAVRLHVAAPSRYSGCMPVPHRQADLENNFTFRRNQLIAGRPTLTKFFSLQDRGLRSRAGLPRFHDDWGIPEAEGGRGQEGEGEEPGREGAELGEASSSSAAAAAAAASSAAAVARENLRRYRATIESDTDGSGPQPYIDRGALDCSSVIRHPVRHLQPWERFHNRAIILPDLPSTPRKMVFLDYRPGESHDDGLEQEETIEVYSSGFKAPSSSSTPSYRIHATPSFSFPTSSSASSFASLFRSSPSASAAGPATTSGASSSAASASTTTATTTTHSSSSSITNTTSTTTASSASASRTKVSYSGAVRPIPAPTAKAVLKSALKKPKAAPASKETGGNSSSDNGPPRQKHVVESSDEAGKEEDEEKTPDTRCLACRSRVHFGGVGDYAGGGQGRGQMSYGQDQSGDAHFQVPIIPFSAGEDDEADFPPPPPPALLLQSAVESDEMVSCSRRDSEDLYDGHVYDTLSNVVAPFRQGAEAGDEGPGGKSSGSSTSARQKPPPVPPTRRNDKPQPEWGRRAITPELKRRYIILDPAPADDKDNDKDNERQRHHHHHHHRDVGEERYSTFPTRRTRHHQYEEVIPVTRNRPATTPAPRSGVGVSGGGDGKDDKSRITSPGYHLLSSKESSKSGNKSAGSGRSHSYSDVLDIFSALSDKTKLLAAGSEEEDEEEEDEEEVGEESLYEALNPGFLAGGSWALTRDKGGGSLGSMDSARLSHSSYGSFGCTCGGGAPLIMALADDKSVGVVGKGEAGEDKNDAVAAVVGDDNDEGVEKDKTEEKSAGFLADNPITLIL